MAPKLDLAIIKALSLDPTKTTIVSHGGSGFASTAKITSVDDKGRERLFFVKTGRGRDSEVMFAGEHASLNAIHSTVPTLSPKSHAHGPLSETPNTYFLATDFLDLSPIRRTSLSKPTTRSTTKKPTPPLPLAKKLALLHTTPAPIPQGYDTAQFGFPLPTCCGSTEQNNSYKEKWSEFYAENRLRSISRFAESKNGKDFELTSLVDRVIDSVVPRLIGEGHLKDAETGGDVRPVVVHGDLWSGNTGRGIICSSFPGSSGPGSGDEEGEGGGEIQDVVFDPSSCYAHAEYDFGIMKMFGGFGAQFWRGYYEGRGKDHPVEEWDDRVELYELYHHLNHYALFGGSYKSGAVSIMKRLLRKYG